MTQPLFSTWLIEDKVYAVELPQYATSCWVDSYGLVYEIVTPGVFTTFPDRRSFPLVAGNWECIGISDEISATETERYNTYSLDSAKRYAILKLNR